MARGHMLMMAHAGPLIAALALAAAASGAPKLQTAVFAGGCFWTMEHGLEAVPGVVRTVSGYTGGREPHPSYQQVSSERTGHMEAVQVAFDPARISYAGLVDRYWRLIDPTDGGGQACDRGPSYRSAIFVDSPEQRRIAEASRAAVSAKLKSKVATEIRDAAPFWPAEAYHQHYADRNPAAYAAYRIGCGRDARLKAVWGTR